MSDSPMLGAVKNLDRRIKLLFIHHKLVCGGAEQALYDLINLLDKEKFEIILFLDTTGGEWEEKFQSLGIRIETEESCQRKSKNPVVKINNWVKRKRIAQCKENNGRGLLDICYPKEHFDIIIAYHSHWKQQKCFRKNSRTVKYIHGDVATLLGYRTYIQSTMDIIPEFDCCICVSEASRQSFMEMTGRKENVYTLYNPLDSDHVRTLAEDKVDLPEDGPVICAVGRLSPEKGFDRLIRIHRNLLDKGYDHKLVIVGEGDEREKLERIIADTATQESVQLVGHQINPYPYIKNSTFLVCSSYSEGLGMVAMEALCLGIPVVSSAPAVGELIGNEMCGIVTESDDASLEAGIEKVLSDGTFYQQLRLCAQRRSGFFDGKRMATDVEKLFQELIEE